VILEDPAEGEEPLDLPRMPDCAVSTLGQVHWHEATVRTTVEARVSAAAR
jgi:hypothetical protein